LITRSEASRRVREAADLGARRGLTGQPLAPVLAGAAAAQPDGKLGAGQVAVIRGFCHTLPGWVDVATRDRAEADLAKQGSQYRPEQLKGLAATMADCINPDGSYTDADRARRRGLTLGPQQDDDMSQLRGWISPELRATIEPMLAKLGAAGRHHREHHAGRAASRRGQGTDRRWHAAADVRCDPPGPPRPSLPGHLR
jgi:hypothetical protein